MLFPSTQILYNQYIETINYYNTNFSTSNPSQGLVISKTVSSTLSNLVDSVYITVMPLTLSNVDLVIQATDLVTIPENYATLITNRINAMNSIIKVINNINIANMPFNVNNIGNGELPANYTDIISLFMNQTYETIPSGLTHSNFQTYIQEVATAFYAVLSALTEQGVIYTGVQYDTVNMLADICQNIANNISHITISSNENIEYAWNNLSLVPCVFKFLMMTLADPTNPYYQSTNIFVYLLDTTYQAMTNVVMSLNAPSQSPLSLNVVYANDTLMTFASRNMGDFSSWYSVALQNNLQPPFISNNASSNVATPGTSLQIPTSALSNVSIGQYNYSPITNYELQYLGTDIYIGNIGQLMPAWTGDFYIIYGYQNLALSIGRRLVTPLGSLIYEPAFGSQIPDLIGNVQGLDTLGFIVAYAESAIKSDPRVSSVTNSSVSFNSSLQIAYMGDVIPNGQSSNGISINQIFNSIGF